MVKRGEAYRTLLSYHAGKKVNRGNLKRKCRKLRIGGPFKLSVMEIAARLKACDNKCDHFRKHGQRYRRRHLEQRSAFLPSSRVNETECSGEN